MAPEMELQFYDDIETVHLDQPRKDRIVGKYIQ